MLIDWTGDFDRWYDRLLEHAEAGDERAQKEAALVEAELEVLRDLQAMPQSGTPTLKRVAQSRRYPVWRVAHPFIAGVAIRLIVWFPPGSPSETVIVLFGADKAKMGDAFYESTGSRADAAIESYLFHIRSEGENNE